MRHLLGQNIQAASEYTPPITPEYPEEEPDQWQTTLVVDSPKYYTAQTEEIVFHSRMSRQENAMVFSEYGITLHGQKMRNAVRYTLEDDDNTIHSTISMCCTAREQCQRNK